MSATVRVERRLNLRTRITDKMITVTMTRNDPSKKASRRGRSNRDTRAEGKSLKPRKSCESTSNSGGAEVKARIQVASERPFELSANSLSLTLVSAGRPVTARRKEEVDAERVVDTLASNAYVEEWYASAT